VLLGMVDLLLATAYDHRTTQGDPTVRNRATYNDQSDLRTGIHHGWQIKEGLRVHGAEATRVSIYGGRSLMSICG
jgi:hypothetical protein